MVLLSRLGFYVLRSTVDRLLGGFTDPCLVTVNALTFHRPTLPRHSCIDPKKECSEVWFSVCRFESYLWIPSAASVLPLSRTWVECPHMFPCVTFSRLHNPGKSGILCVLIDWSPGKALFRNVTSL